MVKEGGGNSNMKFYIKGIGYELRQKYGGKLLGIEGAIGVLEELARESEESGNGFRKKFVWNNDFNLIYNCVFKYIRREESSAGSSAYRLMLNKVDEELGRILRERESNLIPKEKKRMLSMAGVE